MKKLAALILTFAMVFALSGVSLAALSPVEGQPDKARGDVDVVGTVNPITVLDVVVPLAINFTIKADRTLDWPDTTISSTCPVPLDVNIISVNKSAPTPEEQAAGFIAAPDLRYSTEHTSWDAIGQTETYNTIALYLNDVALAAGTGKLGSLAAAPHGTPSELTLTGTAWYGKAWGNTAMLKFKYDMVLEFSIVS